MSKKNLILIIIISLIFGMTLGYFSGKELSKPVIVKKAELEKFEESIVSKLAKSKMVGDWSTTLSGEITKISGRTLTLTKDDESLEIPIAEEAKIFVWFLSVEEKKPKPKEIEFKDIKIGDQASITIVIRGNQLKAVGISISEILK